MRKVFNFVDIIIIVFLTTIMAAALGGFLIYTNKTASDDIDDNLKYFYEAYDKLKDNYYEKVSGEDLINAAIEGMYSATSDPYTSYLNDEDTNNLNNALNGKYKGIGIIIEKCSDGFKIINVIEASPAYKAGLQTDDIITEIDLDDVKDFSINDVTKLIDEKENDTINLTIKRKDELLSFDVDIKTMYIPVSNYKLLDDNIGYISLTSFNENSYTQFKNNLESLEELNINSLIIDLRNNSGGYLDSAKRVAELFLKKGKIIYYLDKKNKLTSIKDDTKEKRNYKISIIINKKSASATEVLASALKDSYGAVLVGEQSYGKGVIQEKDTLKNGNIVKFTTAKWLTPKKKSIDTIGVKPDVEVALNESIYVVDDLMSDTQVLKAVEVLK